MGGVCLCVSFSWCERLRLGIPVDLYTVFINRHHYCMNVYCTVYTVQYIMYNSSSYVLYSKFSVYVYCTVGWRDMALFTNNRHIAINWVALKSITLSNSAVRVHFACLFIQFSFSKNAGALKEVVTFLKVCTNLPLTSKNPRPNKNPKL